MNLRPIQNLCLAALVAGLAACESGQRSDSMAVPNYDAINYTQVHNDGRTPQPAAQPASATRAEDPAPAPRSTGRWPTRAQGAEGRMWSYMAYPTGMAASSVIGIEKGFPRQVNVDETFDYHLVVTNLTANSLDNVTVTETYGPNFSFASSDPSAASNTGSEVTWALGEMAPNETRVIVVRASGTDVGTITSCVTVSYSSALCAGIPVVAPDLQIALAGPAEALLCDDIVYTVTVSNPGSGRVENVRVRQQLPNGLTYNGNRVAEFTIDALEPEQTRQFQIPVEAAESGAFETRAEARSGSLAAESQNVRTVIRQPELAISRECSELRYVGRPIDVTITVENTGNGVARDLVIEEAIPAGARVANVSNNGQISAGNVTWTFAELAPGAERTVNVTYTPGEIGTYRGVATARAYCAETVTDDCVTRVEGIPALLLEGFDDPDPVEIGNTTTYTLVVTNQGSADLTNVRLTCQMDDADVMEFVSASGTAPTGAANGEARGRDINFPPIPRLAPGARATYTVTVRAVGERQVSFRAESVSDEITRPLVKIETTNFYR